MQRACITLFANKAHDASIAPRITEHRRHFCPNPNLTRQRCVSDLARPGQQSTGEALDAMADSFLAIIYSRQRQFDHTHARFDRRFATSACGSRRIRRLPNRRDFEMNVSEQTFDWIFFAIVVLPSVYLVFDWYRNR